MTVPAAFDLAGHSFRVASYAVELARRLGWDDAPLREVFIGGLLHDVGKLFLPPSLLTVPGPLPVDARRLVRRHPELGKAFLERSGAAPGVVAIVHAHHEHWSGRGYPRGLRAESIPVAARLVAVADTYDAIRSHRVYRAGRSDGPAIEELETAAGAQLDPTLVARFAEVPCRTREAIAAIRVAPAVVRRLLAPPAGRAVDATAGAPIAHSAGRTAAFAAGR